MYQLCDGGAAEAYFSLDLKLSHKWSKFLVYIAINLNETIFYIKISSSNETLEVITEFLCQIALFDLNYYEEMTQHNFCKFKLELICLLF
jgi:hypothetical protein